MRRVHMRLEIEEYLFSAAFQSQLHPQQDHMTVIRPPACPLPAANRHHRPARNGTCRLLCPLPAAGHRPGFAAAHFPPRGRSRQQSARRRLLPGDSATG